jgi:hypothetical protein
MLKSFLLLFSVLIGVLLHAQSNNMGIGTLTPHPSAKLDVESSSQGFLCPRMTTVERESISDPAQGLLVFDTSDSAFWFYSGVSWNSLELEIPNFPLDFVFSDLSQIGLANAGPTVLGNHVISASSTDIDGGWLQIHAFGSVSSDSSSIIFRFQGNDLIFPLQAQGDWEANIRVYRENSLNMKAIGTVSVGGSLITSRLVTAHDFESDMLFQIIFTQEPAELNGINLEGFSISRSN